MVSTWTSTIRRYQPKCTPKIIQVQLTLLCQDKFIIFEAQVSNCRSLPRPITKLNYKPDINRFYRGYYLLYLFSSLLYYFDLYLCIIYYIIIKYGEGILNDKRIEYLLWNKSRIYSRNIDLNAIENVLWFFIEHIPCTWRFKHHRRFSMTGS